MKFSALIVMLLLSCACIGCNKQKDSPTKKACEKYCLVETCERMKDGQIANKQHLPITCTNTPTEFIHLPVPEGFPKVEFRVLNVDGVRMIAKVETKIEGKVTKYEGTPHGFAFDVSADTKESTLEINPMFSGAIPHFLENDERITDNFVVCYLGEYRQPGANSDQEIGGFKMVSPKKVESAEAAKELNGILADYNVITMGFGVQDSGRRHAIRFGRKDNFSVIFDFTNETITIYFDASSGSESLRFRIADPRPLKKFLRKYFPDDPELSDRP